MHRRRVLADRITYVGLDVHKDGIGVLEASRRGRNEFCSEPEVPSAIGTAGMPAAGMLRFERRGKVQRAAHRIDAQHRQGSDKPIPHSSRKTGGPQTTTTIPETPTGYFPVSSLYIYPLTAEQDISRLSQGTARHMQLTAKDNSEQPTVYRQQNLAAPNIGFDS